MNCSIWDGTAWSRSAWRPTTALAAVHAVPLRFRTSFLCWQLRQQVVLETAGQGKHIRVAHFL